MTAIEPSLRSVEIANAQRKPTRELAAYDKYLRALPLVYAFTGEGLEAAKLLLIEAVDQDVNFADAWALLAELNVRQVQGGWQAPSTNSTLGLEFAESAIMADSENSHALASAALSLAFFGLGHEGALTYARAALSRHPSSAHVLTCAAVALNFNGDFAEAISLLHQARRFDPIDPRGYFVLNLLAFAHFFRREFEQAIQYARQALELNGRFTVSRRFLAAALALSGRVEEARSEVVILLAIQPSSTLSRSRTNGYRHQWMIDLFLEGLGKAGLPAE